MDVSGTEDGLVADAKSVQKPAAGTPLQPKASTEPDLQPETETVSPNAVDTHNETGSKISPLASAETEAEVSGQPPDPEPGVVISGTADDNDKLPRRGWWRR